MENFVSVISRDKSIEKSSDLIFDSIINIGASKLVEGKDGMSSTFTTDDGKTVHRLELKNKINEKQAKKFAETLANKLFDQGHKDFEIEFTTNNKVIKEQRLDEAAPIIAALIGALVGYGFSQEQAKRAAEKVAKDPEIKKTSSTVKPKGDNFESDLLRKGSRGEGVKELQRRLGMSGNDVDGIFGPGTEKAVRKFQQDNGISVDGIVGPNTKDMLSKTNRPDGTPLNTMAPPPTGPGGDEALPSGTPGAQGAPNVDATPPSAPAPDAGTGNPPEVGTDTPPNVDTTPPAGLAPPAADTAPNVDTTPPSNTAPDQGTQFPPLQTPSAEPAPTVDLTSPLYIMRTGRGQGSTYKTYNQNGEEIDSGRGKGPNNLKQIDQAQLDQLVLQAQTGGDSAPNDNMRMQGLQTPPAETPPAGVGGNANKGVGAEVDVVEPRPTSQGGRNQRITRWDQLYGKTHNADGTPKQTPSAQVGNVVVSTADQANSIFQNPNATNAERKAAQMFYSRQRIQQQKDQFFNSVEPRPKGAFKLQEKRSWDEKYASTHLRNGTPKSDDSWNRTPIKEQIVTEETVNFKDKYQTLWFNNDQKIDEAEYNGKTVKLGKPLRGDEKEYKVYIKDSRGNIVKVNFGEPGMKIVESQPITKHKLCKNPAPRSKATFWSCK